MLFGNLTTLQADVLADALATYIEDWSSDISDVDLVELEDMLEELNAR